MNLAKVSVNGQITVPIEIRRILGIKSGDKVLFFQRVNGDIVMVNASTQAIRNAQDAFSGAAAALHVADEEDVQRLVNEIRHERV